MNTLIVKNAKLLTTDGNWYVADLRSENGVIAEIGCRLPEPPEAVVIDGTGKWLIPGLIDAHVHLLFSMDSPRNESDNVRLVKAVRNARLNLLAGITTVRDVGAMRRLNIDLMRAIEQQIVPGPRVIACGEFIAMTGGHVHYWAREADGQDEVRKAAREQLKAGANLIKLMASGGAADADENPDTPQLTEMEMAVAVEEARRAGVKVAAHAHGEQSMLAALGAGVDTLEHATFITRRVIEALCETGAAIIPTFAVYKEIADDVNLPMDQRANAQRVFDAKGPAFVEAVRAGARYGVGTDAGSYYPPGAMAREMEIMASLGLSCADVLLAATKTNAALLGLDDTIGTLEAGKMFDAVLLNADPLENMAALRQVDQVIKDGVVYDGVKGT